MEANLDAYSHSILARWQKHFSQLPNVHWVNDVRQTDRHTDSRAPGAIPVPLEVEMATEKLRDTNHQVLIQFQQN